MLYFLLLSTSTTFITSQTDQSTNTGELFFNYRTREKISLKRVPFFSLHKRSFITFWVEYSLLLFLCGNLTFLIFLQGTAHHPWYKPWKHLEQKWVNRPICYDDIWNPVTSVRVAFTWNALIIQTIIKYLVLLLEKIVLGFVSPSALWQNISQMRPLNLSKSL